MKNLRSYFSAISASQKISILEYIILFIVLFITFFYGFSSYALENMNEGLYAEIPREMLTTGSYIIPHLNFVPYLEKPPLLYWIITLSYHIFGVSTFSARLIPVTAASIVCLSLFFFARASNLAKAGWISAVMLATSVGFILIARVLIFDMVLTVFFCATLFCFYRWFDTEKKHYLRWSYAFLGLAFLTKGMLAVLLISLIAMSFMLIVKTPWRKFFQLFDWVGIVIFLAIVLPWIVAATLQQSGFAWDYFINEQVMRFLDKRVPRDYHTGPFYYYLPCLLVILLPWTILLPTLFKHRLPVDAKKKMLEMFLWVWFLATLIFFSISRAKGQYYMVIGIPALILLLGMRIEDYFKLTNSRLLFRSFMILMVLIIATLSFAYLALHSSRMMALIPENLQLPSMVAFPLLVMLIINIIYGIVGIIVNHYCRNIPIIPFLLLAGLTLPWIFFLIDNKQKTEPERSAISLGQYIIHHDNNRPVYLYRDYETISSVLFYAQKRIAIVDSVSKDLYFGSQTSEAKGWFISAKDFSVQAKVPIYVVLNKGNLNNFITIMKPLEFCQIMQSGDMLLLSNSEKNCPLNH